MRFAPFLRSRRKALGLTQVQCAHLLGYKRSKQIEFEAGTRAPYKAEEVGIRAMLSEMRPKKY